MKPVSALILISLAVNVGLLAAFAIKPTLAPAALRPLLPRTPVAENAGRAKPERAAAQARSASARKTAPDAAPNRSGLWAALDSNDLPALVSRLRAAGFSRPMVLAIVNAKLESIFADRFKAVVGDIENIPFWKPDPMNSANSTKFWEEYSQIHRERSKMLRDLLGDDSLAWAGADIAAAKQRQFGSIAPEKIDLVQRINEDYAEMASQIRAATQGITLPEDREKLALLEREKRADLGAVLTPAELEEYEMRTSPSTSRLRTPLSIMDASEEEFRAIFKVQQAFNDRINPVLGGMVPQPFLDDRREAQRQMYEQLKATLSPARYQDFVRASNSEYQQLYRVAQRDNVPIETANRAFAIRDGISAESVRIADDTSLSADQRRAALTSLAQQARTQILSTLGPGTGEAYVQSARWITWIERGTAVVFGPDGNVTPRRIETPPRP